MSDDCPIVRDCCKAQIHSGKHILKFIDTKNVLVFIIAHLHPYLRCSVGSQQRRGYLVLHSVALCMVRGSTSPPPHRPSLPTMAQGTGDTCKSGIGGADVWFPHGATALHLPEHLLLLLPQHLTSTSVEGAQHDTGHEARKNYPENVLDTITMDLSYSIGCDERHLVFDSLVLGLSNMEEMLRR